MAKFVICSCENTEYFNVKQHNSPVNIELVTQVEKCTERYYPDNEGVPAIKFHGINIKWVYSKSQKEMRDLDYYNIIHDIL